jgi:phosphoglycolate phosphatase-like HAD superfamily hydrolase
MLPWASSRNFYSPHPEYDVAGLTADTLQLLSPDTPILSRMETMRRAAIYAEQDAAVAEALLAAVLERTTTPQADARATALAWFDAGYLLETYRQLEKVYQHGMRSAQGRGFSMVPVEHADLDGYALVRRALAQVPAAEIEFAASLMTQQPLASAHRNRAASGAAPDSLLARNLASFNTD